MISFKNFLMEGFDPNMKVEFGVNHPEFTDRNFKIIELYADSNRQEITTFFHYKAYSFCVELYALTNFKYMVSYLINDRDYIEDQEKVDSGYFHLTTAAKNTGIQNELIIILNIVLIIIIEALKQFKFIEELEITGTKKELDNLYSKLIKNKSLLKILDQQGYTAIDNNGKVTISKK